MAFKALSDNIASSGEKGQEYLKNTVEYYKLRAFKTITKGALPIIKSLIIGAISLLVIFFISIGISLWLCDILESRYLGYFIVSGFYIVVIVLFILFGKDPLQRYIILHFSDIFFDNDEDPELDVRERLERDRLLKELNNDDENDEFSHVELEVEQDEKIS